MRTATRSTKYERQRQATRSTAGAERLERPLAKRTSTSQHKRRSRTTHRTQQNESSEINLPAGQVKNRYDHKRHEKMERQTEASGYQSAVEGVHAQQSSGDSLQPPARAYSALP